jgi:hypothetical protein
MPVKTRYTPKPQPDRDCVPFTSAEEAWFWFIQAHTARLEGAKIVAGASKFERPCEPLDIFRVMERLYRARRLLMDHVMTLRHYGRLQRPPDQRVHKEMLAYDLWCEALEKMEEVLVTKGIVAQRPWYLPFDEPFDARP